MQMLLRLAHGGFLPAIIFNQERRACEAYAQTLAQALSSAQNTHRARYADDLPEKISNYAKNKQAAESAMQSAEAVRGGAAAREAASREAQQVRRS